VLHPAKKVLPDLTITEESAAEMVAALIFALSDGKPKRIARRVALMREALAERTAEQTVVPLRAERTLNGGKLRAAEANARLERSIAILHELLHR